MASLISRLAEAEGVSISIDHKLPAENIDVWLIKLRSERKSERTIKLYEYLVKRFLKQVHEPTRADVRKLGYEERCEKLEPELSSLA